MDLYSAAKKSKLLRTNCIPLSNNLAIVCMESAAPHIPDFILSKTRYIFLIDANKSNLQINLPPHIQIHNLPELNHRIDFDILLFHHTYEYHILCCSYAYLKSIGYESFCTFMPIPYNAGITTTHIPGYYNSNKEHLEYVYSLLEDQESKEVMASRIRAIETGNIGYIKISEYEEYFHPLVKPEDGDIVIDGGVSENIYPEICFINAVGKNGKIFGFEPDPAGFCTADERLKEHNPNATYKLVPLGLWDKKETIYFKIQGQGTHVTTKNEEGTIACECISIDEFVKTFFLPKVDVIKLDVEGSELNAIKGAVKTILTHKPKLMISLYHKPEDLFKIPIFIKELCEDYVFYMGHHHADLHETILYCRPTP